MKIKYSKFRDIQGWESGKLIIFGSEKIEAIVAEIIDLISKKYKHRAWYEDNLNVIFVGDNNPNIGMSEQVDKDIVVGIKNDIEQKYGFSGLEIIDVPKYD